MRKLTLILLGSALVLVAPGPTPNRNLAAWAASVLSGEDFVRIAGVAGMFEIESSRIATERAKNGDVKAFADRMVTDHTKAAEELKSTATSADPKFMVPDKLDEKHQKMMDELKATEEGKFDAVYVRMQTDAHKEAVALFGGYAKDGDNAALKEFAAKTLPTLEEHHQMIEKIGTSQNLAQSSEPSLSQDQSVSQPMEQNQTQTTTNETTVEKKQAQTSTGTTGLVVTGLEAGNIIMASNLIGSTLYNSANENVGDVNDVIIDKDQTTKGVIVGVGGFLGIGEKDVLVPLDRIQVGRDENNQMKLTITASKEELEQAPAFDRARLNGTATTVQ